MPAAGQPFMAEPDFGTGQNVVLPFPSAQGRTFSFLALSLTGLCQGPAHHHVLALSLGLLCQLCQGPAHHWNMSRTSPPLEYVKDQPTTTRHNPPAAHQARTLRVKGPLGTAISRNKPR